MRISRCRLGLSFTGSSEDHPIVFAPPNDTRAYVSAVSILALVIGAMTQKRGPLPGTVRSSVCFKAKCVQVSAVQKQGILNGQTWTCVSDYVITHTHTHTHHVDCLITICCSFDSRVAFKIFAEMPEKDERPKDQRQGRMPIVGKGRYNLPIGTCRPATT